MNNTDRDTAASQTPLFSHSLVNKNNDTTYENTTSESGSAGEADGRNNKAQRPSRQSFLYEYMTNRQATTNRIDAGRVIRVATINMHNEVNERTMQGLLNTIHEQGWDVTILTETGIMKGAETYLNTQPERYATYWAYVERGATTREQKGGVGLVVSREIDVHKTGPPKTSGSRAITIHLHMGRGAELSISGLYGYSGDQQAALEFLKKEIPMQAKQHIFAGDLNVVTQPHIDVTRNFTPRQEYYTIHNEINECMRTRAIVDAYRVSYPNRHAHTYTHYSGEGKITKSRIDHIWTTADIKDRIIHCYIDHDATIADHAAVVLEITGGPIQEPLPPLQEGQRSNRRFLPKMSDVTWAQYDQHIAMKLLQQNEKLTELQRGPNTMHWAEEALKFIHEVTQESLEESVPRPKHKPKPIKETHKFQELVAEKRKLLRARTALETWHTQLYREDVTPGNYEHARDRLDDAHIWWTNSPQIELNDGRQVVMWLEKARQRIAEIGKELKRADTVEKSKRIAKFVERNRERVKKDPNEIWRLLSSRKRNTALALVAKQTRDGTVLTNDPEECKNETNKAWGKYWAKKGPHSPDLAKWLRHKPSIKVLPGNEETGITWDEYWSSVQKLKPGTAPGHDMCYVEIVKRLPQGLHALLHKVIQTCWDLKELPRAWSHSRIFMLYKNGSEYNPANFRPIALLPVMYKVYTNILNIRLTRHMEENNFFHESQAGFRKGKSVAEHITLLRKLISRAKRLQHPLLIALLDIQKAYDSVEHWSLADTLNYYSTPTNLMSAIMSIFPNATADIITYHGITDPIEIDCGVRQGDGLSPTLFITFLNPLLTYISEQIRGVQARDIKITVLAYADDIVVVAESEEDLQKALDIISSFLGYNHMELNARKSGIIYVNKEEREYKYKETTIPNYTGKSAYKYLGIYVNAELDDEMTKKERIGKFKNTVTTICRKKFTINQKVLLINTVADAQLGYALPHITMQEGELEELEEFMLESLRGALRTRIRDNGALFYLCRGLRRISELYMSGKIQLYYDNILTKPTSTVHRLLMIEYEEEGKLDENTQEAEEEMVALGARIYDTTKAAVGLQFLGVNKKTAGLVEIQINLRPSQTWRDWIIHPEDWPPRLKHIEHLKADASWMTPVHYNELKNQLCQENGTFKMESLKSTWAPFGTPTITPQDTERGFWKKDNRVIAWVDGSYDDKKIRATSAVWLAERNTHNHAFQTYGSQTIGNAELQATECVLALFDPTINLIIVQDSQYAIDSIQATLQSQYIHPLTVNADTLTRIQKRLQTRNAMGATTEMVKVYSHIDEKLEKSEEDRRTRIENHLTELRKKWGKSLTEILIKGNEAVDKLTHATVIDNEFVVLEGSRRFQAYDVRRHPIQGSYAKWYRRESHMKYEHAVRIERENVTRWLWDKQINKTLTITAISDRNMEKDRLGNYLHRALQNSLPLRAIEYHITQHMQEDRPQYKHMMKLYGDQMCPSCRKHKENTAHYPICRSQKRDEIWKSTLNDCRTIITQQGGRGNDLPPWFYAIDSDIEPVLNTDRTDRPGLKKLKEFNKSYGTLGYIPTCLEQALVNLKVDRKNLNSAMEKITMRVQQAALVTWQSRCADLTPFLRDWRAQRDNREELADQEEEIQEQHHNHKRNNTEDNNPRPHKRQEATQDTGNEAEMLALCTPFEIWLTESSHQGQGSPVAGVEQGEREEERPLKRQRH